MIRLAGFISSLLLLTVSLHAQRGRGEDVVYLKNKGIVRGLVIFSDSASVRIQTAEGNVWVFRTADLDHISREKPYRLFSYKTKGFAHYTELGPLVAGKTTIEGVTTAAFSFQTVNGYRFSQYVMAGLGVGADLYATQTIIPVFASFRGDLLTTGNVIPFYFAEMGYGFNITKSSPGNSDFEGGISYALGLGAKIPFNRSAGFLLSIGYRYQKSAYQLETIRKEIIYNRLSVRAGFFL